MSILSKVQGIIDEEFVNAASRIGERARPLVHEAAENVRRYLPLKKIESEFGSATLTFGPPYENAHTFSAIFVFPMSAAAQSSLYVLMNVTTILLNLKCQEAAPEALEAGESTHG